MKKQVLVTGGAGFIGSHLCQKLLEQNQRVVCVDNFITSKEENIQPLLEHKDFQLVKADVSQPLPEEITTAQWAAIYHLASPAGPHPTAPKSYLQLPIETYLVNSVGTHQLLELSQKNKAKFLFASTSEVYGDPQVHPQTEGYWGNVNPVGPRACYDESKRFGEMATMVWFKKHHLNARIIRIFNTYGPRMNPADGRAVIVFITQALKNQPITIFGDGNQTRSFCYVDDLVAGLMSAMEKGKAGEIFNLGNPNEITIKKLAQIVLKNTNSNSEVVYQKAVQDDPRKRRPDINKAEQLLKWKPKVPLEQGLKKTIEWATRQK